MMCSPGNGQNITALNARGPEPTQKQPGISGHVGLFPSGARTWKNQWSYGRNVSVDKKEYVAVYSKLR